MSGRVRFRQYENRQNAVPLIRRAQKKPSTGKDLYILKATRKPTQLCFRETLNAEADTHQSIHAPKLSVKLNG